MDGSDHEIVEDEVDSCVQRKKVIDYIKRKDCWCSGYTREAYLYVQLWQHSYSTEISPEN